MVIVKMPERLKPWFSRYIGIDYSGAETPDSSLMGLRVYEASRESVPVEVDQPPSPRKYWIRRGLAEWLAERLSEDVPAIVGIDHGFSFPLRYFEIHWLEPAGRPSSMISRSTGRPTPNTPTSMLSVMVYGAWRGPFRQRPLAAYHRGTDRGQVGLSFRGARLGGQIDPRRSSLAAILAHSAWGEGPFLAVRWLGDPFREIRTGGGLPVAVEQELSTGRPYTRPTRRLCRLCLAAAGGYGLQPQ